MLSPIPVNSESLRWGPRPCFCFVFIFVSKAAGVQPGLKSTARVIVQGPLCLRIVSSLIHLCTSETFWKCFLNQSKLNMSCVTTTSVIYFLPNGHIFSASAPMCKKSQRLLGAGQWGQESSLQMPSLHLPQHSHSARGRFSVSPPSSGGKLW